MLCITNEAITRDLPFADICKLRTKNNLKTISFSKWWRNNSISNWNKVNLGLHLAPFTKSISTWIIDLNISAKTIKCSEERAEYLCDLCVLIQDTNNTNHARKNWLYQSRLYRNEKLLLIKRNENEKVSHRLRESIRIYKEPLQLNNEKTTQLKNWAKLYALQRKIHKWLRNMTITHHHCHQGNANETTMR